MKIQAAVLRGADQPFSIENLDLSDPGLGEVLVRVVGAGMCHTDLLARHGFAAPLPMVYGHEGSGVVEAVGPGVSRVSVGDHVVMSYDSCGWCGECLSGEPSYCADFASRNLSRPPSSGTHCATDQQGRPVGSRWFGQSSFATRAIATERNIVKVDPSLQLELLGPLGCGIQTGAGSVLNALRVRATSSIAVFGAGAVGLAAIMAAKVAGASVIVAIDLHAKRRNLALELGATHAFDGADPDLAVRIADATRATGGANYAFDTTGVSAVMSTAISTMHPRGVCGLVGATTAELKLVPSKLVGRSIRFIIEGDSIPQQLIPKLIELWREGRFPFDRLIQTYPLSAINDAERDTASGETIKAVLLPPQ